MTEIDYDICTTQGYIYRYAAEQGYDMEWFSNEYLSSDFCRRAFDTIYSRFQVADEQECFDFILPEIEPVKKVNGDDIFCSDVAEWIGFVYRQLYIETGKPSSELLKIVNFSKMCRYYPGLHTVDEEMATDIICENHGLQKIACNYSQKDIIEKEFDEK